MISNSNTRNYATIATSIEESENKNRNNNDDTRRLYYVAVPIALNR